MKKFLLIFLIFLACFFVFAEEDYLSLFDNIETNETTTDSTIDNNRNSNNQGNFTNFSGIPDFKLTLYGEHKADFRMPLIPDHFNFTGDIKAPKFLNKIGIEINYKDLKLKSEGSFNIVLNDFSSWDSLLKILPLENSISWTPWKVKLALGLQYFSWGVADGLNPTDNINPRDYTKGAAFEKIPILSALFSMYPVDFFSFDLVYLPFEQDDIFPRDFIDEIPQELFFGQKMDNALATTYITTNMLGILGGIVTNDMIKGELSKYVSSVDNGKNASISKLGFEPKNFILGGKTNFRFAKVDFSFSYLYDFDQYYTPEIRLKNEMVTGSAISAPTGLPSPPYPTTIDIPASYYFRVDEIKLVRNRVHKMGTDIKATIDRFGFWGEFCFTLTDNYFMDSYKKRNHKASFTVGMDFNYGPNDDFYFNFQYFGEANLGYDDKFYSDYKDGKPDSDKINDEKYMEEFYYRAMVNRFGAVEEGFINGISLKMSWPVLDNLLTPSFTGSYILPLIYDYEVQKRYGSIYLNPELDIMPIDSFHILIGADLYFSWIQKKDKDVELCTTDRLGTYHKDSSIYLAFKYKWGMDFVK